MRELIGVLLLLVVSTTSTNAWADDLVEAEGVNLVRGHCSACHSLSLVTSQRGDRAYWLGLIRWMQETQNLWQIPVEHEEAILSYLSEHYAETDWGRRINLPPALVRQSVKHGSGQKAGTKIGREQERL